MPCRAQTGGPTPPPPQTQSAPQCANTPYSWQRLTLANADDRVFKLDVLTGDAWVMTDAPSAAWVLVHRSKPGTQPAVCPRFRIIQTKHDVSLFSPYDSRISNGMRNTAVPSNISVATVVWLLDTETGRLGIRFKCRVFRPSNSRRNPGSKTLKTD